MVAKELGVKLHLVQGGELADPAIAANPPDRCYLCKRSRLKRLTALARDLGLAEVAEGSQIDDAKEDRPGARAVRELGVKSPLASAGLDKAMVRKLSEALELPTAMAPSSACLATRVPFGVELTQAALSRVGPGRNRPARPFERQSAGAGTTIPWPAWNWRPGSCPWAVGEDLRPRVALALAGAGYERFVLDLTPYGETPTAKQQAAQKAQSSRSLP